MKLLCFCWLLGLFIGASNAENASVAIMQADHWDNFITSMKGELASLRKSINANADKLSTINKQVSSNNGRVSTMSGQLSTISGKVNALEAHKPCQVGRLSQWTPDLQYHSSKMYNVKFSPPFSRRPSAIVALSFVEKKKASKADASTKFYFYAETQSVTTSGMKVRITGYGIYGETISWVACQ